MAPRGNTKDCARLTFNEYCKSNKGQNFVKNYLMFACSCCCSGKAFDREQTVRVSKTLSSLITKLSQNVKDSS